MQQCVRYVESTLNFLYMPVFHFIHLEIQNVVKSRVSLKKKKHTYFWKQETFLYPGKKEHVYFRWIRVIGSEGQNKSKDCSFPVAPRVKESVRPQRQLVCFDTLFSIKGKTEGEIQN